MKVALLGYDTEGKASFEYYKQLGADITICDLNTELQTPEGVQTHLGDDYLENLDEFEVLVRTAGMHPQKVLDVCPEAASRMTTAINEFLRVCPTLNVIGVTGTKGKGTTSTLIYNILKTAGHDVYLGGNIGVSPLTFLQDLTPESWVVLELSSFQLIDCMHSPQIGVCLMVVPEHLNWHADMNEYLAAKSRLFEYQSSADVAIYFEQNALSSEIAAAGAARKIPYFDPPGAWVNGNMVTIAGEEICTTDELKLLGAHNWQNVCAAITAVWQAGVHDIPAIRSVLTSFSGLEHRLEFVRELNGVQYFDDSFGTTPETAIVAVQAFTQPKVLILGGSDKGASYAELAEMVTKSNIRKVLIIGQQGPIIQAALAQAGYNDTEFGGTTMEEIAKNAQKGAQSGDIVLLSTGCASFDMFANYKDRGDQFKQAVRALV